MEPQEELLNIANILDELVERSSRPEIQEPLQRLERSAEDMGKSWSGSWLGYHANVYYEGFQPRPPGAHFSQEQGLKDTFVCDTVGRWAEYDPEVVKTETRNRAGNPDLGPTHELCEKAHGEFDVQKINILSIIELQAASDSFLGRLREEIDKLVVSDRNTILKVFQPQGQIVTADMLALGQGLWTPPHFSVLIEVLTVRHTIDTVAKLATLARQTGAHLSRRRQREFRVATVGTNVFIGHGRSPVWRELKDFIENRLNLPVDEFNRVPIAGVANIARLSEMMDAATIALLVLTGEDEQPDGRLHARMNVVHEAGLFQGRLGFTRAIVLLEDDCEEFSNIAGLGQIRFAKGNIRSTFEEIREVFEREGVLSVDDEASASTIVGNE